MNNAAVIIKVNKLEKHPNADALQIVSLFGTQVIVGNDTKLDDILVYVDSNMKMSDEFLHNNNQYRHAEKNLDQKKFGFFDDGGRVKCIKLRGELSDGFLFPIDYLNFTGELDKLKAGYEFNDINGVKICEKYIPKVKVSNPTSKKNSGRKAFDAPMFVEHWDTSQFMRNKHRIPADTIVYVEEKVHGTSGRTARVEISIWDEVRWFAKVLLRMLGFDKNSILDYKYLNGTRRVVHYPGKKNNTFHDNTMREEVLENIHGQLNKGEQLYYELFGYEKNGAYIQKGFPYGCKPEEYRKMLYRVTMNNADGIVIDQPREYVYNRAEELGFEKPHLFEKIYYSGTKYSMEKLEEKIIQYAQGQSESANDTLKEGVVIWYINDAGKWEALKYKSDAFRLKESSNKDKGIIDQEDLN